MNYVLHTRAAFAHLQAQPASTPHHISLYVALFQLWNAAHFPASVMLLRDELMWAARIGSRSTYLTCLRDLTSWGLITYQPSQSQHHPSRCLMHECQPLGPEVSQLADNPDLRSTRAESESSCGQALDQLSGVPRNGPTSRTTTEPSSTFKSGPSRGQVVSQAVGSILKTDETKANRETPFLKQQPAASKKKKVGFASPDDLLSGVKLNDQQRAAPAPKVKVTPKRKPPSPSDSPAKRGDRPGSRPEIPFAESELADPEAFVAAFANTDFALANLRFYYQKVANWRKDGEPPRRRDWKATAKNFMLNDIERNALVLAPPPAGYGSPAYGSGTGSAIADYYDSRYA